MISITSEWLGEATVDGVSAQIPIEVTWNSDDPLVLSCTFDGTAWDIGRDLIREALSSDTTMAGEGDVAVFVEDTSLFLALSTLEGEALVWMPKHRMQGFLDKTYNLAPMGEEQMDMDSVIERILSA